MKKWCLFILLACYGCMPPTGKNGDGDSVKGGKRPGGISLTRLSGLAKAGSASPADSNPAVINLDTVAGSSYQYFILQNTGDEPVRNIVITTENPRFVFKPSQIPVLEAQSKLNLVQVLRLAVTHGKRLEGSGYDSLLKMGLNLSPSSIKGTTLDGSGAALALEYHFDLSVFAKVMDVHAVADKGEIDLANPGGSIKTGDISVVDLGFFPLYLVGADSVTIANTGNAGIELEARALGKSDSAFGPAVELRAGDSLRLKIPVVVAMDAGGVAVDSRRLSIAPDGKCYLVFDHDAITDSLPPTKKPPL